MKNKKDLRIIKTNNALFNALLELMKEKTFEEIKISDICSCALINRSTFYDHYEDKYDLLMAFLDNFKNSLLNELKKNENEVSSKEYFMELLKILTNHIDEKRNIYSAILSNNKNGILTDILIDALNKDITERIKLDQNITNSKIPDQIIIKFYLGAIFGIGMEWINNPNKYKKEEIINYLDKLIPDKI